MRYTSSGRAGRGRTGSLTEPGRAGRVATVNWRRIESTKREQGSAWVRGWIIYSVTEQGSASACVRGRVGPNEQAVAVVHWTRACYDVARRVMRSGGGSVAGADGSRGKDIVACHVVDKAAGNARRDGYVSC